MAEQPNLNGPDLKTVYLNVTRSVKVVDNQFVSTLKINRVSGSLDLSTAGPIWYRFRFDSPDKALKEELKFSSISVDGREAAGIFIGCEDGFETWFTNDSRTEVILKVDCAQHFYPLAYAVGYEDAAGNLYIHDPDTENDQRPGGGVPGGGGG